MIIGGVRSIGAGILGGGTGGPPVGVVTCVGVVTVVGAVVLGTVAALVEPKATGLIHCLRVTAATEPLTSLFVLVTYELAVAVAKLAAPPLMSVATGTASVPVFVVTTALVT